LDDSAYQRIKLNIQMKKGESSQAIETAFSLFKSTKDYQYVMKIKSLSQSDWQKNYQKIMDILHSSMNARGFELALKMAEKENDDKNLYALLDQKKELTLFMRFDAKLVRSHSSEIIDFYRTYLYDYLQQHAGIKAAMMVIKILEHLRKIGMIKAADKLERQILNQFPERKTLHSYIKSFQFP